MRMRTLVTRTVDSTVFTFRMLNNEDEIVEHTVEIAGDWSKATDKMLKKEASRLTNCEDIFGIRNVRVVSRKYAMPLQQFIEEATVISDDEDEESDIMDDEDEAEIVADSDVEIPDAFKD